MTKKPFKPFGMILAHLRVLYCALVGQLMLALSLVTQAPRSLLASSAR